MDNKMSYKAELHEQMEKRVRQSKIVISTTFILFFALCFILRFRWW